MSNHINCNILYYVLKGFTDLIKEFEFEFEFVLTDHDEAYTN